MSRCPDMTGVLVSNVSRGGCSPVVVGLLV